MRAVIQRVRNAEVKVDDKITGQIGQGLLILLGVGPDDSESNADELVKKICNLRIFRDSQDKMNLSVKDIDGEILVVSQFTLYADCQKKKQTIWSIFIMLSDILNDRFIYV